MNCPECGINVGCGCQLFPTSARDHKVCADCKFKLENAKKSGGSGQNPKPNVQGV